MKLPKFLTVDQAVEVTGLSRRTMDREIGPYGHLTTVKIGRRRLIPRDAFEDWLTSYIDANATRDRSERDREASESRQDAVAIAARDVLSLDLKVEQPDSDLYVPISDLRLALERAYAYGKRDGAANRRPNARRSA